MNILFDVDGTLMDTMDNPSAPILEVLRAMVAAGHTVYVGSGGGARYAEQRARDLKLEGVVCVDKGLSVEAVTGPLDLIFDDQNISVGSVHCKVYQGGSRYDYD